MTSTPSAKLVPARSGDLFRPATMAVVAACIVNGLSLRVWNHIETEGLLTAIGETFGISVIVWFAIYVVAELLPQAGLGQTTLRDQLVLAVVLAMVAIPLPSASWVGLTVLAIHFLTKPDLDRMGQRAFMLVLALSISMQWARWISQIFLKTILNLDAMLVALLSGSQRYDNLVRSTDGSTTLVILEACSSFLNVSLAFLAWMTARSLFGTRGVRRSAIFVAMMTASVVGINTFRIALIAFWPSQYDLIHGPIGSFVAGTVTTLVIAAFAMKGART